MDLNRITLLGRLVAKPELKHIPSGVAVASARMATGSRYKDQQGEWKEKTTYHSIVVWGKQGEAFAQATDKGCKVYIEGPIEHREYVKKDGSKGYQTEVKAQVVEWFQGAAQAQVDRPKASVPAPLKNADQAPQGFWDEDVPRGTFNENDIPF